MTRRIGAVAAIGMVVAGIVATPRPAQAQGKLELTPFFASYYAITTMSNDVNGDGSNIRIQQTNAPTYGGRLTYWLSRTAGVEVQGAYTNSGLRAFSTDSSSGGGSFAISGNLVSFNGRFLYRPPRTNLHFILGAGIVRRGGDFWKNAHTNLGTKLTTAGAILGAGVRASVTPRFAFNVSLEANLYSFDPDGPAVENKSKFQSDISLGIGVPIALAK